MTLPSDSIIHAWLQRLSVTEVPESYQLAVALSVIGAVLKRQVYVDQQQWKVYPNLSILLVGPSGIGKDTAIDQGEEALRSCGAVPIVGGRTIENYYSRMVRLGDPAACVVLAPEITAFLGGKDYQKSMVQEWTNLLSNKDQFDASIKSEVCVIPHPTITLMAGSTAEWLHKAMPDGALDGGFLPRFLIVVEEYSDKFVPLVKYDERLTKDDLDKLAVLRSKFDVFLKEMVASYQAAPKEIYPVSDARDIYAEWYRNRRSLFSLTILPYANRSRDQVLRIAMLTALSRGNNYIDVPDMQFAIDLMGDIAGRIEQAVTAPSPESACAKTMLSMLPAMQRTLIKALSRQYGLRTIRLALELLQAQGDVVIEGGKVTRREE